METVEILILKAAQLHLRLINLVEKISNMLKNEKFTHFFPKISSLDAKKKWISQISLWIVVEKE